MKNVNFRCKCGKLLKGGGGQWVICRCGTRHAMDNSKMCRNCGCMITKGEPCPICTNATWCSKCNRWYSGDMCEHCETLREEAEELLEICRSNICGHYERRGAKDRCNMMPGPCRLAREIGNGWRCDLGYHDGRTSED